MGASGERERLLGGRLENLRTRQRALRTVRQHFDAQGFVEVETPTIVPSPGLDLHLDAFGVVDPDRPAEPSRAAGPRFLHTSPEYQMKRLLAGGLTRIYQIGKAYRRGERGHLHNPEFTMLEWYRTNAGSDDMMRDTEALVASVTQALTGGTTLRGEHGDIDVAPPWPRVSVEAAFRTLAGVELLQVLPDEERFFRILIERVEPALGRDRPVFLTRYPASMASLARPVPEDPRFADRFEAYVDGIELANGFGELVDPVEQRARLERDQRLRRAHGKEVYPIDERFLAALAEGIPPSGGNALGVDRLIMLLVGTRRIDDVLAFTTDEL